MANVFSLSYAATNVTTSNYTTLVTSTPFTISSIQVADTSGQLLVIAKGLAGHEIDLFTTPISGNIIIPCYILQGERLSIKSITSTATSGFNVVSFLTNNVV